MVIFQESSLLLLEYQMILLHGFIKKSQKTPNKEIELARNRKNEWLKEI